MSLEYRQDAPIEDITEWAIYPVGHIFGYEQSGQTLAGPHELGAQTISPPGIVVNEPVGAPKPISTEGWRHNIWRARPGEMSLGGVALGSVWFSGEEQPVLSTVLTLKEVVTLSALEVPDALEFIQAAVKQEATYKSARIRPMQGRVMRGAESELAELEDLRKEAREMFGDVWVRSELTFR